MYTSYHWLIQRLQNSDRNEDHLGISSNMFKCTAQGAQLDRSPPATDSAALRMASLAVQGKLARASTTIPDHPSIETLRRIKWQSICDNSHIMSYCIILRSLHGLHQCTNMAQQEPIDNGNNQHQVLVTPAQHEAQCRKRPTPWRCHIGNPPNWTCFSVKTIHGGLKTKEHVQNRVNSC